MAQAIDTANHSAGQAELWQAQTNSHVHIQSFPYTPFERPLPKVLPNRTGYQTKCGPTRYPTQCVIAGPQLVRITNPSTRGLVYLATQIRSLASSLTNTNTTRTTEAPSQQPGTLSFALELSNRSQKLFVVNRTDLIGAINVGINCHSYRKFYQSPCHPQHPTKETVVALTKRNFEIFVGLLDDYSAGGPHSRLYHPSNRAACCRAESFSPRDE